MRLDKMAVTAQEALQASIGVATDAEAGSVEPVHLLKALLDSGERNLIRVPSPPPWTSRSPASPR